MPRKLTVTRRPTYGDAVRWIAINDAPGDDESEEDLSGYISVQLVAELFGADPFHVAADVRRTRDGVGRFRFEVEPS